MRTFTKMSVNYYKRLMCIFVDVTIINKYYICQPSKCRNKGTKPSIDF